MNLQIALLVAAVVVAATVGGLAIALVRLAHVTLRQRSAMSGSVSWGKLQVAVEVSEPTRQRQLPTAPAENPAGRLPQP